MKLLIVSQNHRYDNPTSISLSFRRALESLDHECQLYDLTYYINKYVNFFVKKSTALRKNVLSSLNARFLEFIGENNFDAILVVKGTFLLPETVAEISKHTWIACFNPDDPFNSETWGGSLHDNIPSSIQHYSHYFIWSHQLADKIRKDHGIETTFLPFAIDQKLISHFNNIDYLYDVSFIGNGDIERQAWLNKSAELLHNKDQTKKIDVFGRYWGTNEGLNLHHGKFGNDYFKTFYQSKININILRQQNKGATNMRTFEIPATGNFMLHETSEEAQQFFREDVEAVYFSNVSELVDKLLYYLQNESLRKKIARASYEIVTQEQYSYIGRMKTVIDIIKKVIS